MADTIRQEARKLLPRIIEWRRTLHACPEIKMQTFETAGHIEKIVREIGISDIRTEVGGSGVTAVIRGEKPGKVLAIRADCDGLPYPEETGLPFAAVNGNCHSCGHDAHTAMALGAATILFSHKSDLAGAVKFIFQPYEEGGKGAQMMIDDGALENPPVDAFISMHTGSLFNGFKPGEVGYRPGIINTNSDMLRATFHGRGGHGSTPHLVVDPIVMAAYAITQLQTVMSRSANPFDPGVISVTRIQAGVNHNVIPDSCELEGTIRSFSEESREVMHTRIREVFQAVAAGFGGTVDVDLPVAATAMNNDPELTSRLETTMERVVGREMMRFIERPGTWGEDMSRFFRHGPGVYFFHSSIFDDPEKNFPHHHPKFTVNEDTLWSGAAIFADFALTWQQT